MNSQAPGHRIYRSLLAAVVLGAAGYVYTLASSNLFDVERTQTIRKRSVRESRDFTGIDQSLLDQFPADEWIHDSEHWIHKAQFSFRDSEDGRDRYVFWQEFDTQSDPEGGVLRNNGLNSRGSGQSTTISPVVIIWKSKKPDEVPVVVIAKKASMNLSQKLMLLGDDSRSTRVVSGTLSGNVTVTGPKELRITGREFFVNETSMTLRSHHPVDFEWESHDGNAAAGVEIHLDRDSPGDRGLNAASGISKINLDGPVVCQLDFPADNSDEEDILLNVRAASGFEYKPLENTGRFYGVPGGKYEPKTQVVVTRHIPGDDDRLLCPELLLEFHPRIHPTTGIPNSKRMVIGRISARGQRDRPVRFHSAQRNVVVGMEFLDYMIATRQLDLHGVTPPSGSGSTVRDKGKRAFVTIEQTTELTDGIVEKRRLQSPHVRAVLADGGGIERIDAFGVGRIQQSSLLADGGTETGGEVRNVTTVRWQRRLSVVAAPDERKCMIAIDGGYVRLTEPDISLAAREIGLELLTQPADGQHSGSDISLNLTDAVPKVLTAKHDVILRSSEVEGELKDRLTVHFVPELSEDATADEQRSTTTTGSESAGFTGREDGSDSGRLSTISGERLTAVVQLPEDKDGEMEWSNVDLTGPQARVVHTSARRDEEYVATGNRFEATRLHSDLAEIRVLGSIDSPAQIKSTVGHAKGLQINVNQHAGTVTINGSGEMLMIVDKDLNGDPIPPTPARIFWQDNMRMQGREARFIGGTRIVMDGMSFGSADDDQLSSTLHNTTIKSPELIVRFTHPVELAGSTQNRSRRVRANGTPEIDQIHCVGKTEIHQESFDGEQLVGLLDGLMVDLRLNPNTGEVTALGVGFIESTFRDENKTLTASTGVSVRANAATNIGNYEFVRIRADFIGRLDANFRDKVVSLHTHVTVARAPVSQLDEVIDIENMQVYEMPQDSGLLKAEHIDIEQIPGAGDAEFAMKARDNARLYSREFSGDADEITYDSSKEQYVLLAVEGRNINAQQHAVDGRQARNFNGPHVLYNTRTRTANGAINRAIFR